jgi:hypothetical protein
MVKQNTFEKTEAYIFDDLREFFECVHILTKDIEDGTYNLPESSDDSICWDDITWSNIGIFRQGIIGYPSEDLTKFDFQYSPYSSAPRVCWKFELSRETLAQTAAGEIEYLSLYSCPNSDCGSKFSTPQTECPVCHSTKEAINKDFSPKYEGVCPYCGKSIRTVDAQQCRHCLMDWHDPDNPVKHCLISDSL